MSLCFEKFTVIRNGEIIVSDVAKDKALEKIDNTASPCEPSSFCCRARVLGLQPTVGGAELAIAGTYGGYVSVAWEYGEETGQTDCEVNENPFLNLGEGSMLITSLGLVTYTLNVYQNADCTGAPECFTSFTSFGDEAEVDADGGDPLEYEPEIPLCEGQLLFSLIFNSGATGITIDQFTGLLTVPAQDLAEPVSIVYQATCNGELLHIVSVTLTNPVVGLRLLFNDIENVPVSDASDVSDWNTFFDLPANGTAFSSVVVTGNEVLLVGGANVQLDDNLFNGYTGFISIIDETGCVIGAGQQSFDACTSVTTFDLPALTSAGDYCFNNCTSVTTFNLPALTSAGDYCFSGCTSATTFVLPALATAGNYCFFGCTSATTFNLPVLTSAGAGCFNNCNSATDFDLLDLISAGDFCFNNCTSATLINIPLCATLGTSTGDNNVFSGITGNTITINVPASLATADAGNPDGDLVSLAANNTATINYI